MLQSRITGFLFFFTLTCMQVRAQGVDFESGFMKEVFAKAAAEKKLVMVDVFATWCRPCHYMNDSVFTDEKVGAFVNQRFVSTQLDAEAGEGVAFAAKYKVRFFPTILILDSLGTAIAKQEGILERGELEKWLTMAMDPSVPRSKKFTSPAAQRRRSRGGAR